MSEEKPAPTKAELFAQYPEQFIHVDELPLYVTRDPDTGEILNVSVRVKDPKEAAWVLCNIQDALQAFRFQFAQRKSSTGIVGPNGKRPGLRMPFTRGH